MQKKSPKKIIKSKEELLRFEIIENYKLGKGSGKHKYRGEAPKANPPREVIQHDTVDFGEIFAHISIDVFTKEPSIIIVDNLTSETCVDAFKRQKEYFGKAALHQSDEGSEFKGEYKNTIEGHPDTKHHYSMPYKKNDQSFIENFNRSLRSECLGWTKYHKEDIPRIQQRVDEYINLFINERWHMGLTDMMTPAQSKTWYIEKEEKTESTVSRICA